ncbi:baseplate assembly protein [Rhizobium straminoryzae]|uniref:Baseplate assembly protein n=1 Tax=Rhizobium straminoryzae TaxID=1387186 RepID=A0A549T134_9HYPH|nr:baseplate assembly protein [Rhizobium straminoryzae]
MYAPTTIDLSRLPAPTAIETISLEQLESDYKARFLTEWAAQQAIDPTLPDFTEADLATHPAIVVGRAWRYLRNLDRNRVNDGLKALLAPLSTGSNLDALVACRNIQRRTIAQATDTAAAIMEGDSALLRRYLLSFDTPCAGSAGRYLYDAWTAWPQSEDRTLGLWDARVNGYAVHGRRGDTDVVIIGPFGRLPTSAELAQVRATVTAPDRAPEAVSISVMAAIRHEYTVSLVLEVPGFGPSAQTVHEEAMVRVRAAATERAVIAGEIPEGLLAGAAYGGGVIRVRDLSPVSIDPQPYAVPVMTSLTIAIEVRA